MKVEMNYKPFDKEVKVLLLSALKRGYFEQSDINKLKEKCCICNEDGEDFIDVRLRLLREAQSRIDYLRAKSNNRYEAELE